MNLSGRKTIEKEWRCIEAIDILLRKNWRKKDKNRLLQSCAVQYNVTKLQLKYDDNNDDNNIVSK